MELSEMKADILKEVNRELREDLIYDFKQVIKGKIKAIGECNEQIAMWMEKKKKLQAELAAADFKDHEDIGID